MLDMTSSSKREQVYNYLVTLIEKQELKQGDKLPSEKKLCTHLGVSRITVQTALEELRQEGRIYRIPGGGTFVGTAPASAPTKGNDPAFIPFIINDNTPYAGWLEIINGVEDYLKSHSCFVTIHYPHGDSSKEVEVIQSLIDRGARSMIILPVQQNIDSRYYFELIRQGIRLVFVDAIPRGLVGNLVCSNNVLGGYLVTQHLLDQGYRRVALVAGLQTSSARDRTIGYRFAIESAGIPFDERYMYFHEASKTRQDVIANAPQILDDLFSLPQPPDALFCINDYTATDLYYALSQRGIRVPEDIALAGFDNLPVSAENAVPITTVAQDFYNIGYEAARLCYESSNPSAQIYDHRFLPVRLIERASTPKKNPPK